MSTATDRVSILGTERGHIGFSPIDEPLYGSLGDAYVGQDGILRIHDGSGWVDVGTGGGATASPSVPMRDGVLYDSTVLIPGTVSSGAMAANRLYGALVRVNTACVLNSIAINVVTGAASSAVRLGMYHAGDDLVPGALVTDLGAVATTANGTYATASDSAYTALDPGLYYLAAIFSGTPSVTTFTTTSSLLGLGPTGTGYIAGYRLDQAYGALPADASGGSLSVLGCPRLAFSVLAARP